MTAPIDTERGPTDPEAVVAVRHIFGAASLFDWDNHTMIDPVASPAHFRELVAEALAAHFPQAEVDVRMEPDGARATHPTTARVQTPEGIVTLADGSRLVDREIDAIIVGVFARYDWVVPAIPQERAPVEDWTPEYTAARLALARATQALDEYEARIVARRSAHRRLADAAEAAAHTVATLEDEGRAYRPAVSAT